MRPSFFRGNLQKGAARGCLDPTYTLFRAYTGREALEVVKQEKIHLILLDIMMPEMDSLTAMAKIREISNVPIILLTAKSEDMDKILGLDCGADDSITKPFNPVEVAARVCSQLRRYRQLGGRHHPERALHHRGNRAG